MIEIWKPVSGYEEYFLVSNKGNVFSMRSNKLLKKAICKTGYSTVSSRIGGRDGKAICLKVHRLVADAFLPDPVPELKKWAEDTFYKVVYVNHKDGNKSNNKAENLEWVSASQNSKHAYDVLGVKPSSQKYRQLLTSSEVDYILSKYRPRCQENGQRALARKFGVGPKCIRKIILNNGYLT